jgi:hypothetical protein
VSTTYFPTPREGTAKDAAETNPEGIAEAVSDDTLSDPNDAYIPPAPATPAKPTPSQPKPKPVTP